MIETINKMPNAIAITHVEKKGDQEIKAKSCLRIIRSTMFMGLQHKNYGITQLMFPLERGWDVLLCPDAIEINTNQNQPSLM